MHRPIGISETINFIDVRANEVRKILTSFDKDSYVMINTTMDKSRVVVLTDNCILYEFDLKIQVSASQPAAFQINYIKELPEEYLSFNNDIYSFIMNKWERIHYPFINNINKEIINIPEIRGNEEFESLLSMKASEGMSFLKLSRLDIPGRTVMIPIFKGFPKLSKPDMMSIIVKNNDLDHDLIVYFGIFKKNINRKIDMYFKILDIG